MFNLISDFLRRCIKRFFISIKDDCINDIIGYGVVFIIMIISISVSALVNNNKVAFIIIVLMIVIIFSLVFFHKGKNKMSIPAHIWLTDENNSPVIGECLMPTRLGSTELKSFNHSVWIPTDHNTGKLTGTRLHLPITFEKEIDRITPYLFRGVCTGRIFKEAIIKMYRINEAGIEIEYFNITLRNVKITRISPVLFPLGVASKHMEEVEIRYESIEWKYCDGNIMFSDSWNGTAVA